MSTAIINDPRGSLWRKWDLQACTKEYCNYNGPTLTAEQLDKLQSLTNIEKAKINSKHEGLTNDQFARLFVEYLVNFTDLAVVAITNHNTGGCIQEIINYLEAMKNLSPIDEYQRIHIFPGVEIAATDRCHILIIFNPQTKNKHKLKYDGVGNITGELPWGEYIDTFMNGIGIPPNRFIDERPESSNLSCEKIIKLHSEWGFIPVFPHISVRNGWFHELTDTARKTTFNHGVFGIVDIKDCVANSDLIRILDGKNDNYGDKKIVKIITSDAKSLTDIGERFAWIKADPTFEGLCHILNEPDERVTLEDVPPKITQVQSNKTKYIDSISIEPKPTANISEIWFNNTIPLNPELVAIIGNKGKGKSALTDIIGLLCSTKQHEYFTFLSEKSFRQPKDNKARHFQAKLTWRSGQKITKGLEEPVDEQQPELVKYIPQNFLEKICTQIGGTEETEFDKELKKVIFSHVEPANRLGKSSLDELIEYKTSEANKTIQIYTEAIHGINEEIASLEEKNQPEYLDTIEKLLAQKRSELDAHDQSKPGAVALTSGNAQAERNKSDKIEVLRAELVDCKAKITTANTDFSSYNKRIEIAKKLIGKLDNLDIEFKRFSAETKDDLVSLGLKIDEILTFSINKSAVSEKITTLSAKAKIATELLATLNKEKQNTEDEIGSLQVQLEGPVKKYQEYITNLKKWEEREKEITGDEEAVDTIKYYEKQIRDIEHFPKQLETLYKSRLDKTKEVHTIIKELADVYKGLYSPVNQFIDKSLIAKEILQLNFDVNIINAGFEDRIFSFISQKATGTFCGVEEGSKKLKNIITQSDFNGADGVEGFLNKIVDSLKHDKRVEDSDNVVPVKILDQLRKGKNITIVGLYDMIFSLDYLKPRYALRMGNKELQQLSPGERGALLLVFYLLVDKNEIPLIIDQPEENLDNQTVYEILRPCMKEAKRRRQIIIVTHNPNLAVVCDAEQVIHADLDKRNNYRMNYLSGSIENPKINKAIVDVLEGTRPAFDNRDNKYL